MSALADQTWRRDAACRTADGWLFFDPRHEDDAKQICARCPVVDACLSWAVSATVGGDHPEGVFGGMNREQRAEWARRHGVRHGTTTGYTKDGCRCRACRDVMADAKRRSEVRRNGAAA